MSDREDPQLEALEAELREDRLPDPGDAHFAALERRILRAADQRTAPRRAWWRAGIAGWLLRPAPVGAVAGAAVVALIVVLSGGPGDPAPEVGLGTGGGAGGLGPVASAPVAKAPPLSGAAWLERLPPAEELWAVQQQDLPALLALLSDEVGGLADDDLGGSMDDALPEQALDSMTEQQLKTLEKILNKQRGATNGRHGAKRPRPAIRKAG